jgi:competence protein ComEC
VQKYLLHFFVLGSVLGSLLFNFSKSYTTGLFIIVIAIGFLTIGTIKNNKFLYLLCVTFIISGFVFFRGSINFPEAELPQKFFDNPSETLTFTGKISGEPDIRETTTRLVVQLDDYKEKIILIVGQYPNHQIGEHLKFTGKLNLPENFENENGIEFDYINYLAKDRIFSMMYRPRVEIIGDEKIPKITAINQKIFLVKNSFLEKVQTVMPSPESELLGGILLGTKRSLGKDWEDKFRRTGLIHIVVLSGYNITIIADAIFRFFGFLPKLFSVTLSVISILIFAVMVGSGATIVRATIMTLLAVTARISGRTYDVNRALFLAAAIMIIHNPLILLHDPSFQLSFLASIGLINFSDFVKKFLRFIPEKFELREISTATLSTQLAVLPLLMRMTGELSIVAPIVNIMTLQVIPITMLLGFIAGLIAFLNEGFGLYAAVLPFGFLKYILTVVDFFSGFEFAVWKFL